MTEAPNTTSIMTEAPIAATMTDFPTPAHKWNDILESSDFKNVNRYLKRDCQSRPTVLSQKRTILDAKKSLPSKLCWRRSLSRTCKMWSLLERCRRVKEGQLEYWTGSSWTSGKIGTLMVMGPSYADLLQIPVWRTLCFLMKGTYYVENGIALSRLHDENYDDFVLHAAIGSLPLTDTDDNRSCFAPDTWRHAELVFGNVLKFYGSKQLDQVGPVKDRLPLHVAAANCGQFCRGIRRLTLTGGILEENRRHINDTMFDRVLAVSHPTALECCDADQLKPFQLACLNGHNLLEKKKLEKRILKDTTLGSAAICLAIGTSRVPDSPKPQWRSTLDKCRHFARKQTIDSSYYGGVYYKNSEGHQLTLNSVYTMLRADPAFFSHGVAETNK